MFIKYGDLDVTHRLIEYKSSVAFADGYIIGNVPTMQLNLKFDNYDGILDDLDITKYWEVQENENCEVRYFKVYDQPEKYTKSLSLKLYDNNYELDAPYTTQLSYPVTVKDQLDEIETLTGLSIIRTNIPAYILEKEVSWYDNTIVIRNYLGWIAELFGANVFASGKGSLEFVQVTKDAFAKTDTLTNYEKNELYCVSRIYYENGLNPLEKGDTAGNTIFLDSNNLYLTDEQNLIDKLYDQLNGLTFYSTKSISMISIDNLLPGCLVNYNDEFNFMVTDLSITYKGGEFSISEVDGNTPTKNEERVIKKITNSTRIRKLQITQDQEKLKLDIVAKEQEDLNTKMGELSLSNEEIKTKINEIESKIDDLDVSLITVNLVPSATILNSYNQSIKIACHVMNSNEDVTENYNDLSFQWYLNDKKYKTGKFITLTPDDINMSVNVKCVFTLDNIQFDTGYTTIVDESDAVHLGNSFLDVTNTALTQKLNDNGTYIPDWTITPAIITPCIMDGNVIIELSNCTICYKKIINSKEVDIDSSYEIVKDGILSVNKNIMTNKFPNVTYVCDVAYKGTSIRLYVSFSLAEQGVGIQNITTYYLASSKSKDIRVDSEGWTTSIQTINANNKYLWTYSVTNYTDGSSRTSEPLIMGTYGDDASIRSATAPSDTTKLWFDTTTQTLKRYDSSSGTWEIVNDYADDMNNMRQEISVEYNSAITQLKNSLTSLVEELQTTTTNNTTSINSLSSQIIQNASSIQLVTNNINSITDKLTGVATKEEISQWAKFESGVLKLGSSNSPFDVRLSNTELGFYENDKRIAYLSNQQLNISQAVVMKQINLGTFQIIYDEELGLLIL